MHKNTAEIKIQSTKFLFTNLSLSQKKVLIQNNSNVTRENVAVELFVFLNSFEIFGKKKHYFI